MKFILPVLLSLSMFTIAHARTCVVTQTSPVRESINGKTVGHLKSSTPVSISSYNTDDKGKIFAYVIWEGQPLASVKNASLQNQGWVAKDTISCSD